MKTEDMVFVFGSNLSGFHGAGAAAHAHQKLGAPWGKGEGYHDAGPKRKTYALPTKGVNITFMELRDVQVGVDTFMRFALATSDRKYQVTQVGCGLGGFRKENIAPLFKEAPINCFFDEAWEYILGDEFEYWGSF